MKSRATSHHRLWDRKYYMSLNATNVLKNMNGYILFIFFILFTAPLGADDVISSNADDERRRSGKGPVAVKLLCQGEPSATQSNSSGLDAKSTSAYVPDSQLQDVFRDFQPGLVQLVKVPGQHAGINSFKAMNEIQSSNNRWIGTAISETGPPSFPDNPMSYLAGHDYNSRLPQVEKIETPVIVSENIVHRIHRKTASVRTPTGPPDTSGFNFTSRDHQTGTSSSPFFATPDFSPVTRTYSRSMQAMLRRDRLRMKS